MLRITNVLILNCVTFVIYKFILANNIFFQVILDLIWILNWGTVWKIPKITQGCTSGFGIFWRAHRPCVPSGRRASLRLDLWLFHLGMPTHFTHPYSFSPGGRTEGSWSLGAPIFAWYIQSSASKFPYIYFYWWAEHKV